jgi:exoribonuclease R
MIPGILELASRTKYGMTSRNVPIYLFRPLNTKLSPCIVGCSSREFHTNVLALIEVPEWNAKSLTRGHLNRIIGPCGDFEAEHEALVHQYSTSTWKKDLKFVKPDLNRTLIQGISFNIDPVGCRDIDDVFTIGDDGYYYITIADVAEWMKLNPTMYDLAQKNAQTLYDRGKVVRPMLPFQEECSLTSHRFRLGVSLRFQVMDDEVVGLSFKKTMIVNETSYTYNDILNSVYASTLRRLTNILTKKDSVDSYDWVEALMVFYNTEAAKVLRKKGQGILRVHEAPSIEKLEKFRKLGVSSEVLAMKSAKYVDASTPDPVHYGLQTDLYCHATSPIRRFADIVNQFVLKGEDVPKYDLETLNERSREIKKYDRDSFFLNKLDDAKLSCVSGITLNDHRVWVPDWKRIVTCKNQFPEGTKGTLYFSLDMSQSAWKKRMVFRFEDKDFMD